RISLIDSKNVVEIIPEKEFFDQPLTNLNFRIIKSIRVVKGKGELIKIIERGQKFWLTVFDNLPELALIIDEEGIIVSCNKPFSSVFNKHPRELIGKKAKEIINFNFIHNFDTKNLPDYLEEEYDGKYFYITTTKFNFENRLNILLFFKDITEYKKIKEHLFQKDKYTS
ncbi:MAG: PAS domain S-box protein, partial [Caldisericia bacterium]|nr:PAS domain S-box protein [Caldisericia bacterium]